MKEEQPRKSYRFKAFGHPNIKATHFKTLEFTKDKDLTEKGDCIIGIKANFEVSELKEFEGKVKFICSVKDPATNETISSEFKAFVNKDFNSDEELVLRKSFFESDRTYGFKLNRGASRLDRKIVELLKDPGCEMEVEILEGWY